MVSHEGVPCLQAVMLFSSIHIYIAGWYACGRVEVFSVSEKHSVNSII